MAAVAAKMVVAAIVVVLKGVVIVTGTDPRVSAESSDSS